ncbi:MAG: tetratricopeptide repeat protein [Betaproteobacteria bacterium]|nr:tetratricopeptide repeat protein [Betaproteobacteria bacterium]
MARSVALRDLGLNDAALTDCNRALQLNPEDAEAWSNRADALSNLQRFDEAQ